MHINLVATTSACFACVNGITNFSYAPKYDITHALTKFLWCKVGSDFQAQKPFRLKLLVCYKLKLIKSTVDAHVEKF